MNTTDLICRCGHSRLHHVGGSAGRCTSYVCGCYQFTPLPTVTDHECRHHLERLVQHTAPRWKQTFRYCQACNAQVPEGESDGNKADQIVHVTSCAWLAARRLLGGSGMGGGEPKGDADKSRVITGPC